MKKVLGILLVAVALLAFTGCGDLFGPIAEIDSFELSNDGTAMTADSSGNYSIDAGDSFSVYVYGNTVVDGVYSSATDYSGEVTLTSTGTGFSAASGSLSATFDGYTGLTTYTDGASTTGYEYFNPVFSTAGTYTVTITLEDSTGYDVEETFSITVAASNLPWASATVETISYTTWEKESITSTTNDWFKYDTVSGSSYKVYFLDDSSSYHSSIGNATITVYDSTGTQIASGTSEDTSIFTGDGNDCYIKVTASSTDSGYVFFAIGSSSSFPGETLSSSNSEGTANGYMSSSDNGIEVWVFAPTTSSYYDVQWADSYRDNIGISASLTCDVYVTIFDDYYKPVDYRNDTWASTTIDTNATDIYCTSSTPIYIIAESSGTGYYYMDVD